MACPRCLNAKYPAEFTMSDTGNVKLCRDCNYPTLDKETRQRIGRKLMAIKPALVLGRHHLKGIQSKYFGEILDKHSRPEAELHILHTRWEQEHNAQGNFYDWIEDIEPESTVLQLTEGNRADYAVTIVDGKLKGQHVAIKYSEYAFVLSEDGVFYAAPKQTSGENRLHHSSFLSGAPVLSAGVFFCNGACEDFSRNVFYVKDYSGHYTPGIGEILKLKDKLLSINQDLTFWYVNGLSTPLWKGPISTFNISDPGIKLIIENATKKPLPTAFSLGPDKLVLASTGATHTR
jgi:hypothetical protein